MTELYDRVANVLVGPPGGSGLLIDGLYVEFEIAKSASKFPNSAEITIRNLSEATRRRLEETGQRIRLQAGYIENGGARTLYEGDLTRVTSQRQGEEWRTVLESADGEIEYRERRASLSFAEGRGTREILSDIASRFGAPTRGINDIPDAPYPQGFAFTGFLRDALSRVTDKINVEWSFQNGVLTFVPIGGLTGERVPLLTPESGLLGSPSPTDDVSGSLEGSKRPNGFEVESLLRPDIVPGARVEVRSRDINAVLRVDEVRHYGGVRAEQFRTAFEGRLT